MRPSCLEHRATTRGTENKYEVQSTEYEVPWVRSDQYLLRHFEIRLNISLTQIRFSSHEYYRDLCSLWPLPDSLQMHLTPYPA